MTKTITKATLAALALGLSVPAMAATDGSPGATSTGSFTTSLTVLAPANNDVHVLGRQDYAFGTVQSTNANVAISKMIDFVCFNRSTAGSNIRVTVSQNGTSAGSAFNMNDGAGHSLGLTVEILGPTGNGGTSVSNGVPYTTVPSGAGCTASTNNPAIAHQLNLTPNAIPAGGGAAIGALSAQFTVLVAPQ